MWFPLNSDDTVTNRSHISIPYFGDNTVSNRLRRKCCPSSNISFAYVRNANGSLWLHFLLRHVNNLSKKINKKITVQQGDIEAYVILFLEECIKYWTHNITEEHNQFAS